MVSQVEMRTWHYRRVMDGRKEQQPMATPMHPAFVLWDDKRLEWAGEAGEAGKGPEG